ncbi:2-hydroxyacid dehydrogenase [Flavobacteriaceae bacterium]|nr:2-hydroxyacid dehydrogenase [Flavobacteriaceae bacterium]
MGKDKIIISGIDSLSPEIERQLKGKFDFSYYTPNGELDLIKTLESCDVFWFRLNHRLTKEILKTASCKIIACAVTGLDHIDINYAEKKGIKIISLKNEFDFLKTVRATAEHTLGLTLGLLRQVVQASEDIQNGNWRREFFLGSEIYQKKVGIIGLGRLGTITANLYKAFGAEIYYYDIKNIDSNYIKLNSLKEVFKICDIISLHVPLDSSTFEFINKDLFSENEFFLINTSRGQVINEKDIVKGLKKSKLLGYATDVLTGEPHIANSLIWKESLYNKKILVTPHIGGYTKESILKTEKFISKKILEF